jgi:hypothetical protein
VQSEFVVTYYDGVSGIGATAVTDNDVIMLGEDVDNLSFAFVTPLQPGNTCIHFVPAICGCVFASPKVRRNSEPFENVCKDKPQQLNVSPLRLTDRILTFILKAFN